MTTCAQFGQLLVRDPAPPPGDLLGNADLQALPPFQRAHEIAGVQQRVERAGVQPGRAADHLLDRQPAPVEVDPVDVGDLVLTARRFLQALGDLDDVVVVEVQTRNRVIGFRCFGLLLQRQRHAVRAEFDDTIGRRISHPIRENGSATYGLEATQAGAQSRAVEDVVPQHQSHGIITDVIGAEHESLCQTVGLILRHIAEVDTELCAVAKEPMEARRVVRGGDHQDVADAGHHQRGQWVVDHRLVVHRQQLLADAHRDRMQAGARTPGQDDSAHAKAPLPQMTPKLPGRPRQVRWRPAPTPSHHAGTPR